MWYRASEQALPATPPSLTIPNPNTPIAKNYNLIYVDGPICTLTSQGPVTFTYSGPCEPGIKVRAYAEDGSGNKTWIYGTSVTTFATTSALISPNYVALPTSAAINLNVGTYTIYSELSYDGGTTIAYTAPPQQFQIVNSVSSLKPILTNISGTSNVCSGTPLILRAPNSNATWFLNGTQIGTGREIFVNATLTTGGTSQALTYSFTTTANATCLQNPVETDHLCRLKLTT